MNFIPFEQWKDDNPDLVEEIEKEKDDSFCTICHGEEICDNCGQDCPDCGFNYDPDKRLREIYNDTKDAQIKKLKEWEDVMRGAT